DFVTSLFVASTHTYVLIFSDRGKLYWVKVHEIPQAGRAAKGKPIVNLVQMAQEEKAAAILPVKEFVEGQYVVMATKNGIIKKTDLMAYSNPRASGIIACGIEEGDRMIAATLTDGKSDIFLATKQGQAIRFKEGEVRPTGRQAVGVWGIDLDKEDVVVGMEVFTSEGTVLTATEYGYGKRTETKEYRVQSRGGKGIMTMRVTDKNGPVVGVAQVTDDDDVMLISDQGQLIRTKAKEISVIGRATQGVRLIHLQEKERLVALAKIVPEDEDEELPPGNA
ncbi:MAG TPA: DNA gyrase C-terminal beta-propeller domain-containing protein, partial [Bdellovibrionota bacterium]|nr:DNA gyrase C-terminal beta-propeller domain-containing protein [Bdellovibrionota bacterium]